MPPRRNPFFGKTQNSSLFSSMFGGSSKGFPSLFGGQESQSWRGIFGSNARSQSGVGGLSGMISNTQKAIETVQKAAPVVQQVRQYGPLIRNLPSMYKMLKAIKSSSTNDVETNELEDDEIGNDKQIKKVRDEKIDFIQTRSSIIEEKKSLPKFFTPGTRN